MFKGGCQLGLHDTDLPECVYGNPSLKTTVFLLGDSHARQWFAALNKLAKERDWRLVAISKTACPVAEVQRYNAPLGKIYHECGVWRKIFRRIEKENPGLIVVTMQNPYTAVKNGRQIGPKASDEALEKEFVKALKVPKRRVQGRGYQGKPAPEQGHTRVCLRVSPKPGGVRHTPQGSFQLCSRQCPRREQSRGRAPRRPGTRRMPRKDLSRRGRRRAGLPERGPPHLYLRADPHPVARRTATRTAHPEGMIRHRVIQMG